MSNIYPLMPLRDIVVFPHMVAPLVVGRKKSIAALEDALEKKTEILLVSQRNPGVEEPTQEQIYGCGTLAMVMQLLRLPDGTIKALVEGQRRATILDYHEGDEFVTAKVDIHDEDIPNHDELLAYERELRRSFQDYAKKSKQIGEEVVTSISALDDPFKLVHIISSHLPLSTAEKQEILEVEGIGQRIETLLQILHRECNLVEIEKRINSTVKRKLNKAQRDYFLGEKVREMQKEIGQGEDGSDELSELEAEISAKKMPAHAREKLEKEFKKLRNMPAMSAETAVIRNYIDTILALPWHKRSRGQLDVNKAEIILDKEHYALEKPKERILEFLAVQAQVDRIKGPILCLVGPPGVGKTSICRSIAHSMGREFARLSLGGVRDEAEIRGHRRTYVGAMAGKVLRAMQKVGVTNPVFCLDEVDKMSGDFRGDPSSALLEVLDPEQNGTFNDHYLDLDYDLSQVFFITTANSLHGIPAPLRDRMEIIELSGYTEEDKQVIAKKHLLPKQLKANGFAKSDIVLTAPATLSIIRRYTREAGVRSLERTLASLCRKVARKRQSSGDLEQKYRIGEKSVQEYLGTPKYRYGLAEERDEVGLTTGLAWTEVGGALLQIEVIVMDGCGKLTITGKLGDVMQESVQAAYSYVRSRAESLGLTPDFYKSRDIHVHVPEGAIPKDGPSAGITIATTIASALTGRPVCHELAMTGEITLRGRVLPIGGLTEKLLAAKRGNITRVLLPEANGRDLRDVPAKIKNALDITLVNHMDEVLEAALLAKPKKNSKTK